MILVDTSVWVDLLRGTPTPTAVSLRTLLASDPTSVVCCEPIAMELLAGATARSLPSVERLVTGLESLPVDPATDFRSASAIFRAVRASGHTVRSLVDCLIASVAIRHGAALLHNDVDYDRIAAVTPLRRHAA